MKFSLAGPIRYTLSKDWYTYGATTAEAVSFLDKDSILAWWRLDQDVSTSGSEVQDSSGNGRVLTAAADSNRPSFDSGDSPSPRIQDSSLLFATDDFLRREEDDDVFSFGNGTSDNPFSISFYVKPTTLDGDEETQVIVGKFHTTGNNNEYLIYIRNDDLRFEIYSGGNASIVARVSTTTDIFTAGEWVHIVCTYDGRAGANANAGMKIYVNGSLEDTNPGGSGTFVAMSNTTTPLCIGNAASAESTLELNGNLADVAIWGKELSSKTALALYKASVQDVFSNFRNWANKRSTATPGKRVSATYQGININSVVSASSDAFALGVLPFAHVEHKKTNIFRGADQLFVSNFDDTVSFPRPSYFGSQNETRKIGSITITRHFNFTKRNALNNQAREGSYIIPDSARPGGPFVRSLEFVADLDSETFSTAGAINEDQVTYGVKGLEEGDTAGAASRLYDAINAATTTLVAGKPLLNLDAHYSSGTSTIYLMLKDADPISVPVPGYSPTEILGTAIAPDGDTPAVAYATPLASSRKEQLPFPFTDDRDFHGIMSQAKYSTPVSLESPKWSFGIGQSSKHDDEGHFMDGNDFYATSYLTYSGSSALWPINLSNAGSLIGRSFDGVMECFDIRNVVTLDLDLKYDGRTIRGEVQGCYGSNFRGSTEITNSETLTNSTHTPFLDACELFGFNNNPTGLEYAESLQSEGKITVVGSNVTDFIESGGGGFTLQDATGKGALFLLDFTRGPGTIRADQQLQYRDPRNDPNGRNWLFHFSGNGIADKAGLAEIVKDAINFARDAGSIGITATRNSETINLKQNLGGMPGNTEINVTPYLVDVIFTVDNFSGGSSPIGTITAKGAPVHYKFDTRNMFPVDEEGVELIDQDARPQPYLWYSDAFKSSVKWLPSKAGGLNYLNMERSDLAPFIERTYVQQYYQPLTAHNEDNSITLDPIVSAVTNLSSSVYSTGLRYAHGQSGIPKVDGRFISPYQHNVFHKPRRGETASEFPLRAGNTGFYYSGKTDSIAFGDL